MGEDNDGKNNTIKDISELIDNDYKRLLEILSKKPDKVITKIEDYINNNDLDHNLIKSTIKSLTNSVLKNILETYHFDIGLNSVQSIESWENSKAYDILKKSNGLPPPPPSMYYGGGHKNFLKILEIIVNVLNSRMASSQNPFPANTNNPGYNNSYYDIVKKFSSYWDIDNNGNYKTVILGYLNKIKDVSNKSQLAYEKTLREQLRRDTKQLSLDKNMYKSWLKLFPLFNPFVSAQFGGDPQNPFGDLDFSDSNSLIGGGKTKDEDIVTPTTDTVNKLLDGMYKQLRRMGKDLNPQYSKQIQNDIDRLKLSEVELVKQIKYINYYLYENKLNGNTDNDSILTKEKLEKYFDDRNGRLSSKNKNILDSLVDTLQKWIDSL